MNAFSKRQPVLLYGAITCYFLMPPRRAGRLLAALPGAGTALLKISDFA
jgi:hypothetical protein